jgi:acyl-CoA synthetase (AMP-forming)/AMP-acid ligase II
VSDGAAALVLSNEPLPGARVQPVKCAREPTSCCMAGDMQVGRGLGAVFNRGGGSAVASYLRKGHRILVQSRNNVQMCGSCWAAFRLGWVWVPTHFRFTPPPEAAYLGASSDACAMSVEDLYPGHTDAVRAALPALKQVVAAGRARPGEHA